MKPSETSILTSVVTPQNLPWQEVVSLVTQQLLGQTDSISALKAFIPLPPPFSPVQFIELHLNDGVYYRCFDDGSVERSATAFSGSVSDTNLHVVKLAGSTLVELRFVRNDGGLFSADDKVLFSWLARLVTPVIEGLLEQERLREECVNLSHERDQCQILVDTTNSVLSHLETDALVAEVSKEIHRFFGIASIGMALRDAGKQQSLVVYASDYLPHQSVTCRQFSLELDGSMVARSLHENQSILVQTHKHLADWRQDPLLQTLAQEGMQAAFFLPLSFNHKPLGVLILAHPDPAIFTRDSCQLLAQIAARIGIAVENADAYGQIARSKDSLAHENIWLNEQIQNSDGFSDIIYQSQAMSDVVEQMEMVAESDSTVLILGETGTGKEMVARAIHKLSARHNNPMIKMNCAAVPSSLLESDLFGHDKGAFTGATNTHLGRFEMAEGGTLFLDEIGDMPLELQPKLLRVLQEREIERLGGNRVIPVNVRVIAATNRDLQHMAAEREFRGDLYYRLNVFPILLPPLRERPDDIPLLAKFFTQKLARRMNRDIDSIPAEALEHLSRYPWPGNVRELENVIERAVILTRRGPLNLQLNDLRIPATKSHVADKISKMAQILQTKAPENDEEERERIVQVLRETNGIVAGPRGAAVKLGIKRTTLLSRMQRLGISAREV
ncbi:sigma 54-interacting transcriptional regulator [Hafnia alvei]|uniref:sigma 54-interacting transcriptional regulator n=1 Tax=Hafnia alvei TaxID=569 RepID=UPI00103A8854|nr:sigma 54-interacting transcriptional regulator [Hafnia alvei]QBJ33562.1 GAF domain-containing protein [Hafnia alvei]